VTANSSALFLAGLKKLGCGICPGERALISIHGGPAAPVSTPTRITSQTGPTAAKNVDAEAFYLISAASVAIKNLKSTLLIMKPKRSVHSSVSQYANNSIL